MERSNTCYQLIASSCWSINRDIKKKEKKRKKKKKKEKRKKEKKIILPIVNECLQSN
jgi:hypothetical protein